MRHRGLRSWLILAAGPLLSLIAATHGTARIAGQEPTPEPSTEAALASLRGQTAGVLTDIKSLREALAEKIETLEAIRVACRRRERAGQLSRADNARLRALRDWFGKTKALRASVHSAIQESVADFRTQLTLLISDRREPDLAPAQRAEIARLTVSILEAWIALGEPAAVRSFVLEQGAELRAALRWVESAQVRRDLIQLVADRTAATPGQSDVDTLCATIEWEALLLSNVASGDVGLDLLSEDLVLLFTDRASDAMTRSSSTRYRHGRCRDAGFGAALCDGSDQVRHATWALRLYSLAEDLDVAQRMLGLKELNDMIRRKLPLNEADLALNRAVRAFVEAILDDAEPPPIKAWAALLRDHLAG